MRVLLVQAPTGRPEEPIYPVGLAYLAGQLSLHELRAMDLSLPGGTDATARLLDEVSGFEPDVVAVSFRNIDDSSYPVTHSYVGAFSETVSALSSWKGILIAGGTGFSLYPDRILSMHPRIDFGVPGEAEGLLPELLAYLEGSGAPPGGWGGGRLLPRRLVDMESISPPRYDILDLAPYDAVGGIGIQSRRGCPRDCAYCTYGYLGGRSIRCRPVPAVVSDLVQIAELGATRFQFVDSLFNQPVRYFRDLTAAVRDAGTGLRWAAWLDETVFPGDLDLMREAGAEKVDFSPDAITDRGLALLGKPSRASELLPAVRSARERGFTVGVNFFNDNPGEGLLALLRKLLFMLRVRLTLGWRHTFVNIGTVRAYAHSRIAEDMLEQGYVDPECDFFEPVFVSGRGPSDWLYRLFGLLRRTRARLRKGA
ncbi:cobalamin-dependent protein [Candidatus Fermentibacterales bacterium]|nr:cobalamin-dependent protein [Candidatus Fermentibacterales bacterium]